MTHKNWSAFEESWARQDSSDVLDRLVYRESARARRTPPQTWTIVAHYTGRVSETTLDLTPASRVGAQPGDEQNARRARPLKTG